MDFIYGHGIFIRSLFFFPFLFFVTYRIERKEKYANKVSKDRPRVGREKIGRCRLKTLAVRKHRRRDGEQKL